MFIFSRRSCLPVVRVAAYACLAVVCLLAFVAAAPIPTLTRSAATPAVSTTPSFTFSVVLSEPVSGLSAASFAVDVGHLVEETRSLSGSGSEYELSVTVQGGHYGACPTGFTGSYVDGRLMCGKSVEYDGSWDQHRSSCSPFALAAPQSTGELEFFAGLRGRVANMYWYVVLGVYSVLVCCSDAVPSW